MINIFSKSTILKTSLGFLSSSLALLAPLTVVACQKEADLIDRPLGWYSPFNTKDGSANAFANDPCTILFNEEDQLFYSWMLFRNGKGFPAGWIEMTSPDLNNWTQGEYRIKLNEEFSTLNGHGNTSALGGSVWIDTEGAYFEPGDAVFVLSMQPSKILSPNQNEPGQIGEHPVSSTNYTTDESGIAYFVSHGLGKDFYTSGVLSKECLNLDGTNDWRDTAVFQTDDGLYFAISAHNRVEFWKINRFADDPNDSSPKISKVSELFVRNVGVEVPNVVRLDQNLWYVSASVQDNPFGGPFQSAWWTLCEWDSENGFIPVTINEDGTHTQIQNIRTVEAALAVQKAQPKAKVIDWDISEYKDMVNPWIANEYGTEGYAQRVSNPYQAQDQKNGKFKPDFLIARSMASNWAYDTDIWAWKGGTFGSERISFSDTWIPNFAPNDVLVPYEDNGSAVYHLKASDLVGGYTLNFDWGNFELFYEDQQITWNNKVLTSLNKWTNQGGYADLTDDITIVWNKSALILYDETQAWNAHFMLPQGVKHFVNPNAQSIQNINRPDDTISETVLKK